MATYLCYVWKFMYLGINEKLYVAVVTYLQLTYNMIIQSG